MSTHVAAAINYGRDHIGRPVREETTMSVITNTRDVHRSMPALSVWTLGLMFISGFFATNAFDLW